MTVEGSDRRDDTALTRITVTRQVKDTTDYELGDRVTVKPTGEQGHVAMIEGGRLIIETDASEGGTYHVPFHHDEAMLDPRNGD